MVAEVIINSTAKKLNRTFDYNIPAEMQELVQGLKRDKIVQLIHLLRLDGVGHVYVGFHRSIVRMASPLHHDIDGDTGCQGIADERAPRRMAGEKLVLLFHLIGAFSAMVGRKADLFRKAGKLE